MIETCRSALIAGELTRAGASFFSFGTNDLTQMTYGLSRDDSDAFLRLYIDRGIIRPDEDPFQTLDAVAVGELLRVAIERARAVRPEIEFGVCGEHGGDPKSISIINGLRHRLLVVFAEQNLSRATRRRASRDFVAVAREEIILETRPPRALARVARRVTERARALHPLHLYLTSSQRSHDTNGSIIKPSARPRNVPARRLIVTSAHPRASNAPPRVRRPSSARDGDVRGVRDDLASHAR